MRAGIDAGYSRSSLYRSIPALIEVGEVSEAGGRLWVGEIGDPDLALAAEVTRTLATLRMSGLPVEAKLGAAQQLSRSSARASSLRSQDIVALLGLAPSLPRGVQEALLPFAQRALRSARGEDSSYARAVWEASRGYLGAFLADPGGLGTMAWNAVYEAVAMTGLLGDEEILKLADRAISVETKGDLPPPSAALAVLRRVAAEGRLRNAIWLQLNRLAMVTKDAEEREGLRRLIAGLDLGT